MSLRNRLCHETGGLSSGRRGRITIGQWGLTRTQILKELTCLPPPIQMRTQVGEIHPRPVSRSALALASGQGYSCSRLSCFDEKPNLHTALLDPAGAAVGLRSLKRRPPHPAF